MTNEATRDRFLIWIDAVGGFLVCAGDAVTLGQAVPGCRVDVPLLADVSRLQLTLRRDAEGYVVDPHRETAINGRRLGGPLALCHGDRLSTGPLALEFLRPHPLSATARLNFASSHRTRPTVDAVLLMGDSCVLGPAPNSHVVCRHWRREVVLFRRGSQLSCHAQGHFEIDGRTYENRGPLGLASRVSSDDFSFCLEAVQ